MTLTVAHLQPIVSLIVATLILIVPRLFNYIVAIFLIVSGVIGLGLIHWRKLGAVFRADGVPLEFSTTPCDGNDSRPRRAGRLDVLRFARERLSWPRISGSRRRTSPPQEKP